MQYFCLPQLGERIVYLLVLRSATCSPQQNDCNSMWSLFQVALWLSLIMYCQWSESLCCSLSYGSIGTKKKPRLWVLSLCQMWSCAGLNFGTWPRAFWLFQPASDISLRWFRKLLETTWGWTVNACAEHTHQWSMSLLFHFSAERQTMG